MAGTFVGKYLADGQLPNAIGDLYTVPALTVAIIKTLILVNVTAGAITTNIYVKKSGGTARRIWEKDYSIPANEKRAMANSEVLILGAGDKIQGDASAVTSIDYSIFGVEET